MSSSPNPDPLGSEAQQSNSLLLLGAGAGAVVRRSVQVTYRDMEEGASTFRGITVSLSGGVRHDEVEHRDRADGVELMTCHGLAGREGGYGLCDWAVHGQRVHRLKRYWVVRKAELEPAGEEGH